MIYSALHCGLLKRNLFVSYFRSCDAQGLFLFPLYTLCVNITHVIKWSKVKKQMDQSLKFVTFTWLCHGYIELIIKLHLMKYNKFKCSLLKV